MCPRLGDAYARMASAESAAHGGAADRSALAAERASDELVLRGLLLESMPEVLSARLTSLDLSRNRLSDQDDLFAAIAPLALATLNLSGNALSDGLDPRLGLLGASLSSLAVSANMLTALPETLSSLSRLTFLDVASNALAALPEAGLQELSLLRHFNGRFNQLVRLPAGMGQWTSLEVRVVTTARSSRHAATTRTSGGHQQHSTPIISL